MRPATAALLLAITAAATGAVTMPAPLRRFDGIAVPRPRVMSSSAAIGVQPPTALVVTSVQDRAVTLSWTPPDDGAEPTGYVLEGGFQAGEVLGSLPVGNVPVVTLEVPAGVVFVRVHAIHGVTRSAASNEVRVVVGSIEPPSTPANLLGLVNGGALTLTWSNTFSAGTPTHLRLDVTGDAMVSVPLDLTESFTYAGVPGGTYTFRVVAANLAGESLPSNAVTLTFPTACSGPPAPPTAFRAWQVGSTLTVDWSPPASGPSATSYTVHVSGAATASLTTSATQITGDVPPGHYAFHVVANNPCGSSAATPAAADWTAVVRTGATYEVHFTPPPGSPRVRVYWTTTRADLESLGPTVSVVETAESPVTLAVPDPSVPVYYQVFGAYGPILGQGGPVAVSATFALSDYRQWPANVMPAFWDVNGDGCLDALGAWGHCDGTFTRYALADVGLQALAQDPHKDRDSRFADFTGDGIVDLFSNVYTRADDLSVRSLLHVGRADGTFVEDAAVSAMGIRGYGETIVAADFDNDGDVDVFLPHYSHLDDGGRNWLLVNDGTGRFTDRAQSAGVAVNLHHQPEGAQALDVDEDGWIDLHVASHVFLNNGDLTFSDAAADLDLPVRFDEGLRLGDLDLDGDLDLVHHDTYHTRVYANASGRFGAATLIDGEPDDYSHVGYGLSLCDVNGDGFEDLVVADNVRALGSGLPRFYVNVGGRFMRSALPPAQEVYNDVLTCADLDGSGLPDIVGRWTEAVPAPGEAVRLVRFRHYVSRGEAGGALRLRVVDAGGRRNQQGRVVRVRPLSHPARTLLRIVESGSGLLAQGAYDLLVGTPWPGEYEVAVRFAHGWVTARAHPGAALTIRADGTVTPGLR
jgi:hypothetical protein